MMKTMTVAGLLVATAIATATAATLIRSRGVTPETTRPRDYIEAPPVRQRKEPTILRAQPQQSPFLLPHFLREVEEEKPARTASNGTTGATCGGKPGFITFTGVCP